MNIIAKQQQSRLLFGHVLRVRHSHRIARSQVHECLVSEVSLSFLVIRLEELCEKLNSDQESRKSSICSQLENNLLDQIAKHTECASKNKALYKKNTNQLNRFLWLVAVLYTSSRMFTEKHHWKDNTTTTTTTIKSPGAWWLVVIWALHRARNVIHGLELKSIVCLLELRSSHSQWWTIDKELICFLQHRTQIVLFQLACSSVRSFVCSSKLMWPPQLCKSSITTSVCLYAVIGFVAHHDEIVCASFFALQPPWMEDRT